MDAKADEALLLRCLECASYRAPRIRAKVAGIAVAALRGEPLPVKSVAEMTKGCCARIHEDELMSTITVGKTW